MNRELLQQYIDKSYLPMKSFTLGVLDMSQYAEGYAKDENGWFVYEVTERQYVHKDYFETEQECIDEVFVRLKFALENEKQTLPDLTETTPIWSEEEQREWLEKEITDDLGTKRALELCSEKMGFAKGIYAMMTHSSFEDIVEQNILDYEQIQVADIVYSELNDEDV